jgi:hypothetical protein
MDYASTFEKLLHQNLTGAQFNALPTDLGYSSSNKFSRLMNNPGTATNSEVIFFAQLLQVSAWELYNIYGLGKDRLSDLEAIYLRWIADAYTKEPTLPHNAKINNSLPPSARNKERGANHGKNRVAQVAIT